MEGGTRFLRNEQTDGWTNGFSLKRTALWCFLIAFMPSENGSDRAWSSGEFRAAFKISLPMRIDNYLRFINRTRCASCRARKLFYHHRENRFPRLYFVNSILAKGVYCISSKRYIVTLNCRVTFFFLRNDIYLSNYCVRVCVCVIECKIIFLPISSLMH